MLNLKKLSIISVLLVIMVACTTFKQDTYKTLSISKSTYDIALTTAGDLYKQGRISDGQKAEVITLGNIYLNAHNAAVMALLNYNKTESMDGQRAYLEALSSASMFLADLLSYIQLLEEGG